MKIYFDRYKIGKPDNIWNKNCPFFTLDIGFFVATGNNAGIQFGFVTYTRTWYSVRLIYNRFKRRAI